MWNEGKIELLSTELLNSKIEKSFLRKWQKLLRKEVGWHYPLDLIWQLKELDKLGLKKGNFLDAGAGNGLMQYLIAAKGHDVLSIDFARRVKPRLGSLLFPMEVRNNSEFSTDYIDHLTEVHNRSKFDWRLILQINWLKLLKALITKKGRGKVVFYEADLTNLVDLEDESIDAVFSTSAVEHIPEFPALKTAVSQLWSKLKVGGKLIITTSGSKNGSWFHKPSKGWCFSLEDLNELFSTPSNIDVMFDYDIEYKKTFESEYLKKMMPSYYYTTENCGMPNGVWDPKYLPVGIVLTKRK